MIKLEHDGEVMSINAEGLFEEVMSELTEVSMAFIERMEEHYGVDKLLLVDSYAKALFKLASMDNLYEDEDSLFV